MNCGDDDSTNVPLIITTNETGTSRPRSTTGSVLSGGNFGLETNFKAKSCRSFIRQPTKLGNEHRNKSVPHNLQVW